MTKVGRLFEMEKEEAVEEAVQDMRKQLVSEELKTKTAELKVCILQLLLKGNTIAEAAEKLHMEPSDAARLIEES